MTRAMPPETPTSLPTTSDDAECDGRGGGLAEALRRDGDSGVRQREQGDDEVAGPRVEEVLEAFRGGDRLADAEGDVAHLLGRDGVVGGELIGDAVGVDLGEERSGGCEQAEGDAGDGGVDAGLEHGEPDVGSAGDVDGHIADAGTAEQGDAGQSGRGGREPARVEAGRVEGGDDDDGADVVDDREAEQEDLELRRHACAEHGQQPEGEGDVGRHGDAPPRGAVAAGVEGQVGQRGDRHAPDRTHDRDCCAAGDASSPLTSSCLISRPMTRKNNAIRPSLIQCRRSSLTTCPARSNVSSALHRSWYDAAHRELAQTRATAAATASIAPPEASICRNR